MSTELGKLIPTQFMGYFNELEYPTYAQPRLNISKFTTKTTKSISILYIDSIISYSLERKTHLGTLNKAGILKIV